MAIIFLPLVGALLYLFMNVFNKKDLDKVQDGFTAVINPTKKIKDLEKKFKFSNTFKNQVALADCYLESNMLNDAILNYESSLKEMFYNDYHVISKLIEAYYQKCDYEKVRQYAERVTDDIKFKKSKGAFYYSLALEKLGDIEKSEMILNQFDAPYANYLERLELSKFYIRNSKLDQAKLILNEILVEAEGMSKQNLKQNKVLIRSAKELLESFS
ncbi:hypothetical protein [Cellulophaga sp. HaHaR_3_176]|uniref:hypothetical protein n=1 Tax=Cellulophaga sp. HaHaR_3_176 TaxID=1942464 RepID=UPI0020B12A68|nr:hypothetical protein [Cellulophaga sp. HaHaR_3_176]